MTNLPTRTRAAIYARYSSDRQSERSIDDQVALCREHAGRLGLAVAQVYTDYAISGAAGIAQRPGLAQLMADATAGAQQHAGNQYRDTGHRKFDTVLSEALDRLSRDQADVATIAKRLAFAGVTLVTVSEGEIGALHIGLKGTMNALYLTDLAAKVRRGLRGRVEAGRSGGGLSYGYRPTRELDATGERVRGGREIDAGQAAIVRRIFAEYLAGRSPRAIAKGLNADGIPAAGGGAWYASAINGNAARANGILCNPLYAGRLVWNRTRMVKHPETGRRTHRLNPSDQWIVKEMPGLAIVDAETWQAAQDIKAAQRKCPGGPGSAQQDAIKHLHRQRRPKRLLSGLVVCGRCGGRYTMLGQGRLGCVAAKEAGTCDNRKHVLYDRLERAVLDGLRLALAEPDRVAAYVEAWQEAEAARVRGAGRRRRAIDKRLAAIGREEQRCVDAVVKLGQAPELFGDRLAALAAEKAALAAERRAEPPMPVTAPHPALATAYGRQVERLQAALNDETMRDTAAATLRVLIERIVVTPSAEPRQPPEVRLDGRLAEALRLASERTGTATATTLVAGEGLEPPTRGL